MIELKTFDTHTGEYLLDTKGQPIVENLRHSILEYLYPNEQFCLAEIDDRTTVEELQQNAPDGQVLLASSSGKFLFGRPEIREKLDEVFPHLPEQNLFGIKDRAAYGALLLSDCTAKGEHLRVLVVDDDDRQFGAEAQRTMADFKATGRLLVDVPPQVFAGYEPDRIPHLVLPVGVAGVAIGNHLASVQDIAEKLNIADRSVELAPRHFQRKMRVLIVDDESGENGGFLSKEAALALTGDCHGKISPSLALSKFGIDDQTAIQFRGLLHIDDRYPDSFGTHKVCKGGIVAQDLTKLDWQGCEPPDIILAKSSFKGSIKPKVGLYEDKDVWLGEKDRSRTGTQSISSALGLYPNAIKDVMPILQPKIEELAGAQNDLRAIAKLYCKSFEQRLPKFSVLVVDDADRSKVAEIEIAKQTMATFRESGKLSLGGISTSITGHKGTMPELILLKSDVENLPVGSHDLHVANIAQALQINTADVLSPLKSIDENEVVHVDEEGKPVKDYEISTERYDHIKAILESGNDTLLQSGLVAPELKKFLRKQWLNLAEGKDNDVKFDRGFCVPDKGLQDGEICVPWLPEGADIITYRAPLINTNGVHILKNNHLGNDYSDPKHRPNFILTSDSQDPARGYGQSVMADFGMDFDGDCVAVAEASRFPNLAADVANAQLPANRYLAVVKEAKIEFEGDQASACLQMRNNLVGRIANVLTRLQSQITEVDIIRDPSKCTDEDRATLAGDIKKRMGSLWWRNGTVPGKDGNCFFPAQPLVITPENLSPDNQEWFTKLKQKIERQVEGIYKSYPNETDKIFTLYRQTLRDLVDVAAYQNQIALDMQKSARKADVEAVVACNKFTTHRLDILHEKKSQKTYASNQFTINGATPQEILAHYTNLHFEVTGIHAERPFCFKELYDGQVPVKIEAEVAAFKRDFDSLWYEGTKHLSKFKNEEGCVLIGETDIGKIEITNLCRFNHSQAYDPASLMEKGVFYASPNNSEHGEHIDTNHKYVINAIDPKTHAMVAIGTICEFTKSAFEGLNPADTIDTLPVDFFRIKNLKLSAPSPDLSSQLFNEAREKAQKFANSVPEDQREIYAAALWKASCGSEGELVTPLNINNDSLNKISAAILYAFPAELNDRVHQASLRTHKLSIDSPLSPEEVGVPLYFKSERSGLHDQMAISNQNAKSEGEPEDLLKFASRIDVSVNGKDFYDLGRLQQHSLPMNPNGEIVSGKIVPLTSSTMRLQVAGIEEPLVFGKVGEYALAGKAWVDSTVKITLAKIDTPKYSLMVGNRSIGEVSGDGVKFLESQDLLKTGLKINAKIAPLSNGKNRSVDVEIPMVDGSKLNFRTSSPNYLPPAQGEIAEIKVQKMNLYSVGVFMGDGEDKQQIGEFTNVVNSDKALRKLIDVGAIRWDGFTEGRGKLGVRTSPPVILQPEFEAVLSGSGKDFAIVLDSAGVDRPLVPVKAELGDSIQSRLCQHYLGDPVAKPVQAAVVDRVNPSTGVTVQQPTVESSELLSPDRSNEVNLSDRMESMGNSIVVTRVSASPQDAELVKIDRTSVLGNPFYLANTKDDRQRDLVVAAYGEYAYAVMDGGNPAQVAAEIAQENNLTIPASWKAPTQAAFGAEIERLVEIASVRPLALGCHCAPAACHGDVIKDTVEQELANRLVTVQQPTVEQKPDLSDRTKIVISGSRSIQTLPDEAKSRIDNIVKSGAEILVGDAPGIDTQVQKYLKSIDYDRVTVYHAYDKPRNNQGFPTQGGFSSYVARDEAMCDQANYGLVVWDGQSRGSKANIDRVPSWVVKVDITQVSDLSDLPRISPENLDSPAATRVAASPDLMPRRKVATNNFDEIAPTVSISLRSAEQRQGVAISQGEGFANDEDKIVPTIKISTSSARSSGR